MTADCEPHHPRLLSLKTLGPASAIHSRAKSQKHVYWEFCRRRKFYTTASQRDRGSLWIVYVRGQLLRKNKGERFQAVDNSPSGNGTWGDFNNDGFVDLFSWDGKGLLCRNVDGKSFERTRDVLPGLPTKVSLGTAWADFNNEGWLKPMGQVAVSRRQRREHSSGHRFASSEVQRR